MLARLETIDGVLSTAVDHHGEFLRLGVEDERVFDRVRQALTDLGYDVLEASPDEQMDRRWYGSATVRELSREEARIIADRVVPPFALSYGLPDPIAEQLASTVSAALFECFAAHTLGSGAAAASLRNECSDAVAEAAAVLVGADVARDLAARIDTDLDESSAGR